MNCQITTINLISGENSMGLFSFVSDAISTVGSFVSGALSTVGSFLSNTAGSILSGIGKCIPVIREISIAVQIVAHAVKVIGEIFKEVFQKEVDMEEIGAKIRQDGTRPQMEGETAEEYLNYLTNDVELDKEKHEKTSIEDKLVNMATGLSLVSDSLNEKLGVNITGEFLMTIGKLKLEHDFVDHLIKNFALQDLKNTDRFVSYLKNDLVDTEKTQMANIVKTTLLDVDSNLSEREIQNKIYDMKYEFNKP